MRFDHLLAVVAVRDLQASREWYKALQVFEDPERAGSSLFNLAVDASGTDGLHVSGAVIGPR